VHPALTWKTRILSLREMRAGQALGYGGTYTTKAPARIAVLPVGYADGLNRGLSSGGRVIVREHYAPIVGRISMDLTLVDVTGIPGIAVADEVVLLGSIGGLIGLGIPEDEASFYQEQFRSGKMLVTVQSPGREEEAEAIIHRLGGVTSVPSLA
jgi:alanine racemase